MKIDVPLVVKCYLPYDEPKGSSKICRVYLGDYILSGDIRTCHCNVSKPEEEF